MNFGGSGNPGTFRTCSAVLCIEFLLFEERKKEEGKKEKLLSSRPAELLEPQCLLLTVTVSVMY
jgi:hypothetical protein